MADMYLVTIVVPVYNVEPYLKRCVESLVRQEKIVPEILLIDDGSTDRSGKICDECAHNYENVKVVHKKNGGLSSARNVGIEQAKGQYILFVDSDDYIEENTVSILKQVIEKHDMPDTVVFDGIEDDGCSKRVMRGETSLNGHCVSGKEYLLSHYRDRKLSVEACLYLYRKSFLDEHNLRFCTGILHEDVEFTPRALLLAKRVTEIPDRFYHYMVRPDSISTMQNREKNIQDLFQTLKELNTLAENQDPELCRWMKNAVLNSYLNMIYDARMYQEQYRSLIDKNFLRGKAATPYNRLRAALCIVNVRLYCIINDMYKKLKSKL